MKDACLALNMPLSSSPGKQTQLSSLPYPSPKFFASESLLQEFSLDTSPVFRHSLNKHLLSVDYMPESVPGGREGVMSKKDTAPALMELIDQRERQHSTAQEAIQSEQ